MLRAIKRQGPIILSHLTKYIRTNAEDLGLNDVPSKNIIKDAVNGLFFAGDWLDYECSINGHGVVSLFIRLGPQYYDIEEKNLIAFLVFPNLPALPTAYAFTDTPQEVGVKRRKADRRSAEVPSLEISHLTLLQSRITVALLLMMSGHICTKLDSY